MRHAQDPLGIPGRDVGDGVGDIRSALDDVVVAVALLVLVPLAARGWKGPKALAASVDAKPFKEADARLGTGKHLP